MSDPEVYYRYEDRLQGTGGYDIMGEWEPGPSHVVVNLFKYPVLKHTPKGVWISQLGGRPMFICQNWRKKFACPTIEEAKHSFIKRKERQAGIYEARAMNARKAIQLINGDKSCLSNLFTPVSAAGTPPLTS